MSRPDLEAASERLRDAAAAAGPELAEALTDQAETVASLAAAENGPDHGRLARLEHTLRSLQADASGDVPDHVEAALEKIKSYRETVEGV